MGELPIMRPGNESYKDIVYQNMLILVAENEMNENYYVLTCFFFSFSEIRKKNQLKERRELDEMVRGERVAMNSICTTGDNVDSDPLPGDPPSHTNLTWTTP